MYLNVNCRRTKKKKKKKKKNGIEILVDQAAFLRYGSKQLNNV